MTETLLKSDRFHERLKSLRLARGLSVSEISKTIGVPVSTYREWENGRLIQGHHPYGALAQALGVSLLELLTGKKPELAESLGLLAAAEESLRKLKENLLSHSSEI
jgi:transcriptional regulator with XRE-family HTH domain